MYSFYCYVVGPEDSVYRHKLLKLKFDIPPLYPLKSPAVKFIQYRGERIHPNFYKDGKVCLSILGTWAGEPWATSMTTDSVLRTVQSLLDNEPYKHEPNQRHDAEFSEYVRYTTWQWLLLDYVHKETDPDAKAWLQKFLVTNGKEMMTELRSQQDTAKRTNRSSFQGKYGSTGTRYCLHNYPDLLKQLENEIATATKAVQGRVHATPAAASTQSINVEASVPKPIPSILADPSLKGTVEAPHGGLGLTNANGHAGNPSADREGEGNDDNLSVSSEKSPKKHAKKGAEVIDLT